MAEHPIERPPRATGAHLRFLEELRKSGVGNLFGAGPWLEEAFGISAAEAWAGPTYWMQAFAERHPRGEERGALEDGPPR